jgi:isopentenyldiphosphate isomerase
MAGGEVFDVINKNDEVIGTATREECHSNPDLMHRCVHFTVIKQKATSILLTQRSLKKKHDPGKFCFLGEHVLSGESYEDAVRRGVKEELGFVPDRFTEAAHDFFTYQAQSELVRFYIIDWKGEDLDWNKDELEEVLWVDKNKIADADYDYSEMTKYWIDNVDWDSIVSRFK